MEKCYSSIIKLAIGRLKIRNNLTGVVLSRDDRPLLWIGGMGIENEKNNNRFAINIRHNVAAPNTINELWFTVKTWYQKTLNTSPELAQPYRSAPMIKKEDYRP